MAGSSPWGSFEVPAGTAGRWRVGPLSLHIQRLPHEWRLTAEHGPDPLALDRGLELPLAEEEEPASELTPTRFAVGRGSDRIVLAPRLPDRALLTRFEQPLVVPASEQTQVYVTSPLWVRVDYGPKDRELLEVPSFPLSDAWLGPSTMVGELAFAAEIPCQTELDRIPRAPARAITAAWVDNRSSEPLEVTRLSLPVRRLGLFEDGDELWTSDIRLTRQGGDDMAEIDVTLGAPECAPKAVRVAPPRDSESTSAGGFRAFVQLFR